MESPETISTRGYFMTDRDEKAANWEILERYEKAKGHLVTIEDQLAQIGQNLMAFARTMKDSQGMSFEVQSHQIRVTNTLSGVDVTSILKEHVNWESLVRLISDLKETRKTKAELASRLKDLRVHIEA
jgi:hypothetical protein